MPPHLLRPRLRGLYVITDGRLGGGHVAIARAALAGGARIVQLRDKTTRRPELLTVAREIRALTRAAGALFIVNDRTDIAQAAVADGVHLGPEDLPIRAARHILGPHFLIGNSCGDPAEARAAQAAGADYIGAGDVFGTATKPDAGIPIGIESLRSIVLATTLPVAAVGGVSAANIPLAVHAGAAMFCVVSAVAAAGDEEQMIAATRTLAARAGS